MRSPIRSDLNLALEHALSSGPARVKYDRAGHEGFEYTYMQGPLELSAAPVILDGEFIRLGDAAAVEHKKD